MNNNWNLYWQTILDKLKKRNKYLDIRHSADAKKMVALYDYDPHDHSPHLDNDVSIIQVFFLT